MSIDRNAKTPVRIRRNWQRLKDGGATASIVTTPPINNTGSAIELTLGDGLTTSSQALTLDLDGSTLALSGSGLSVAANGIGTTELANDAVTTAIIDDSAVTDVKLATDSVTTVKIVDDAVTTAKIDDDAVTNAKIAAGAVDTTELANDAVTSAKIAAGAVDTTELANDAVTTAKLDDDAVTNAKVAANAIDTAQLAADSVTTAKIAAGAVGETELGTDAVSTVKIQDLAVTEDKLAADAVTTSKIANFAVTDAQLASDAVTTAKIANFAVTDSQLATNSVTTNKLANDAVDADKLGIISTAGDLLYFSTQPDRLPLGTTGHILTAGASAPAWATLNSILSAGDGLTESGDSGLAVAIVTNGGLAFSSGSLLVDRFRTVSGDPSSPSDGDTWFNSTAGESRFRTPVGTVAFPHQVFATTNTSFVRNTTTPTNLSTATFTLPAEYIQQGKSLRFTLGGRLEVATNANLSVLVKFDGTLVAGRTNRSVTPGLGAWYIDFVQTFTGSSDSGATGVLVYRDGDSFANIRTPATVTHNVDTQVTVEVEWSVADIDNDIRLEAMSVNFLG